MPTQTQNPQERPTLKSAIMATISAIHATIADLDRTVSGIKPQPMQEVY